MRPCTWTRSEKLFHKCQLRSLHSRGQHEEVRRFKRRLGASLVALVVKNLPANAGDTRDTGLSPGSGRCPGESDTTEVTWHKHAGEDPGLAEYVWRHAVSDPTVACSVVLMPLYGWGTRSLQLRTRNPFIPLLGAHTSGACAHCGFSGENLRAGDGQWLTQGPDAAESEFQASPARPRPLHSLSPRNSPQWSLQRSGASELRWSGAQDTFQSSSLIRNTFGQNPLPVFRLLCPSPLIFTWAE